MSAIKIGRRKLLQGSLLAGTGALSLNAQAGFFGAFSPVKFKHGVASGDPMQNQVIIWTRVTPKNPEAEARVLWIVSENRHFSHLSSYGFVKTDASKDFTVKVDVAGLEPGKPYYYKFIALSKHGRLISSPIGKTQTLPEGDIDSFKMAVFSCANYPAGYFHAYAEAAKQRDIDVVLHLGDYIYEYGMGGYATQDAEALGRIPKPLTETVSLEDYRARYGQYRTDRDLQRLHRRKPFICVWDDHEVANDTYDSGAENHDASEGPFEARKRAALQAYYEWMPVREGASQEEVYRSFEIGNLVSLYMLDTRLIARDKQLDYANYIDPLTGGFDSESFIAAISDPQRELLGPQQLNWLSAGMATSSATWQVLGQQVLMGRMNLPAAVATQQISLGDYAQLAQLAQTNPELLTPQQIAILQLPSIPYNLDAWDGYAVEREKVLGTAQALGKNLVCLAGDTHNAWANNLETMAGDAVGVEFATPGVSSPGLETYLNEDPALVAAGVTQLIEPLKYANTGDRGFMTVTFSENEARADWVFVSSVKQREYSVQENKSKSLMTTSGPGGLSLQAL